MTALRPRSLTYRGVVEAAAFVLRPGPACHDARFSRALAMIAEGAVLQRLPGDAWLARLPRPGVVRVDAAPGAPLARLGGGHLSAVPLSDTELAHVPVDLGPSVLWLQGGRLHQVPLAHCPPLDLAELIATPEFKTVELEPLSDPPTAVRSREPAPTKDTRNVLGDDIPPASEAQVEMLESLKEREAALQRGNTAAVRPAGSGPSGFLRRLFASLGRMARVLGTRATGDPSRAQPVGHGYRALPTRPGLLSRAWTALRSRLALLTLRSPIGALLNRRQARYVRDMLDKFESGDLREALRYAIPLGAGGDPSPPALGGPGPRADLTIGRTPMRASTSLLFGDELHGHLDHTYRTAAKRLEQQERYREAAFVYAELLRDAAAAVALLGRGGLLREAAEIAEGHGLPPGLVVRQWFLAKDLDRAIDYAMRHDAFSDAVRRLAATDLEAASALRLIWARRLADAGDFVAAVHTIWPVESARHIADAWMARVIAAGGVPGAQMLASAIRFARRPVADLDPPFRKLMDGEGFDAVRERAALVHGLAVRDRSDGHAARYAPALIRQSFRDAADGWAPPNRDHVRQLERLSGDKLLGADLPALDAVSKLEARWNGPLEVTWDAEDRGTLAVTDVAVLPDGGHALALGEGGVRLLRRDGRIRAHLEHPAEALVIADNGNRAIVAARRGALTRLTRVDLLSARAEHWTDLELHGFARTFDGQRFFVQQGRTALCLDAQRQGAEALWRVSDESFAQLHITRGPEHLLLLTRDWDAASASTWEYELPSFRLRKRAEHVCPQLDEVGAHLIVGGTLGRALQLIVNADGGAPLLAGEDFAVELPAREGATPVDLRWGDHWAIATHMGPTGCWLDVVGLVRRERVCSLQALGAQRLATAIEGHRLAVVDDRGRLADIDLERLQFLRDARMFA
ncbi:MAG: bpX6 domain-containing protein [Myxococcales bacterium]|nr:bpX6 domain-containing protein [Myxococcales bacterium]